MISIQVKKRELGQKTSMTAKHNDIKAVVYGPKQKNMSLFVPYASFIKAYNTVGTSGLIELDVEGQKIKTLIHDISLDPVRNFPIHIDFYAPEAGKKVHAEVPLKWVGESAAVKGGALLVKVMHEIEIEALPENLPHDIEVDISKIVTLDDDIKVADLVLPAGVVCKLDPETVVTSVVAAKEETEEAPIDLSAIEVEQKGKKEEEEPKTE